jgi:3,4-dihydroxy 2-butanone 4-phosphate synthase/GTP cyclohydrolase II
MSDTSLIFSPIPEIIAEIAAGRLVIVADDPSRENEADLVGAASLCTPEMVNFMAIHARGLICAPLTAERAEELELPQMTRRNREGHKTAFTISVDAAQGVTTGISAADRALTIRLLADPNAKPDDFVQPGHVFPLQAVTDGVLRRAGHTEAALDLAGLAGLPRAAVICEIMNDDGTMGRVGQLGDYQHRHGLKACTIAQLIEYRRRSEKLVHREQTIKMPTDFGEFDCHLYRINTDTSHHLALRRDRSRNTDAGACAFGVFDGGCFSFEALRLRRPVGSGAGAHFQGWRGVALPPSRGTRHRSACKDSRLQIAGRGAGYHRGE